MKTLDIRRGRRLTIRALAVESSDGTRDKCETLAFFQEHARIRPKEMDKLGGLLSDTAKHGPPSDEKKFKQLKGTDLYEFKTHFGLRLLCFWHEDSIICTHGYLKDGQKAPKNELSKAQKLRQQYLASI